MASETREGVQIAEEARHIACFFRQFGPGICTVDANKTAPKPCEYCTKQHPEVLREAIMENPPQDDLLLSLLNKALQRLQHDTSQLPAGDFLCFSRYEKRRDFDDEDEWFDLLIEGRRELNEGRGETKVKKPEPFPHVIGCEAVKNPLALCPKCTKATRWNAVEWIEEEASSTRQKKLFTVDGVATYNCMMMEKPEEKELADLSDLWENRIELDGPEGCGGVLLEHQICANDYAFYRKKPGGKEVIDKYFGEDRMWRNTPVGL